MIDMGIVIFYLISTLAIGLYCGRGITSLRDFSVSQKSFTNSVMLATLFATVIGGGSTCGIVTNVYKSGLIFMIAFYGAAINKLLVAHYVSPRVQRYKTSISLGDIFQKEYGKLGKIMAGVCILFVSVACLAQQITAIGFIFEQFFKIPFLLGLCIGYGTLVIYSSFGGVRAVVATDVYQFIFILAFIPLLFIVGLENVGWFQGVMNHLPKEKLSLFSNSADVTKAMTMFVVMTFSALDPSFIHRLIMSRDEHQAAYITKITGYLSFPLFTVMGILGLIAYVVNNNVDPNLALPYLIDTLMPPFLRGLVISALLAVIMSTADSNLHVVGLSVVQDLIIPIRGQAMSDKHQILLARSMTFFLGLGALVISLYFNNIFDIMIFAFGFWGPTILVPFIFLLFGRIFSKKQLLWGVFVGQSIVVLWNIFLRKYLGLDGFIPAMIFSSSYFSFMAIRAVKKGQNDAFEPTSKTIKILS
jgi:SSS family solute:Na+ symporter